MPQRSQLIDGFGRDTIHEEQPTQINSTNSNSMRQEQLQQLQQSSPSSEQEQQSDTSLRYYTVKAGDSWWSLADLFDVSLFSLSQLNGLSATERLQENMVLKVPHTPKTEHLSQTTPSPAPAQPKQESPKQEESKAQTATQSQQPTTAPAVPAKPSGIQGYNPELGKKLASASAREAGGKTRAGGRCYYHVANAVDAVIGRFLSGGHAYMAASQLAARKNLFTEIPASNLSSLPAGAIVVWGKGNSKSGHISVAQGNGMETSDFIGSQMTSHYGGAGARVFLPKARM